MLKNIELDFISKNYNTTYLENGEDDIFEIKKMNLTLTTLQNQNNNSYHNTTKIDLGKCESSLREVYKIPNNTLFLKKVEVFEKGMKIPKIEFDIYCNLYGTGLIKLDLSICEKNNIYLSIPIEITENLDKLNTSSEYYNNICSKAKSDSGTDISLNDRKNEFIEKNKTVCQENCDFIYYNESIQIANCSCKVKKSSSSVSDITINKEKLYENFGDKKTDKSNLAITSCNVLSSKENIKSNTGFYLLLLIIAFLIFIFILFCIRGYNSLEEKIDEVIYKKFKNESENNDNKLKESTTKKSSNKKVKKGKSKKNNIKSIPIRQNPSSILNLGRRQIENRCRKTKDKKLTDNNSSSKPDTDYELNWLSYEDALRYEKRTKCDYYISLIIYKQLIIFTFCSFNDYNSNIIKKFILFLSFALHYTLNALFFTESNFHQIYIDEGKFNFEYQIKYIILSAFFSTIILRLMLNFLVLTDKDVLDVKLKKTKSIAIDAKKKKLKYIKIKFTIFFILNFILLGLFWYYLTSFNAIYENTQIYLIINTCISFGISLIYPFIINIIPMIIRKKSLKSKKKNKKYLYKISQIIQII